MTIEMTSNKPYLIKAFYDWISDNELTPYIVVKASMPYVMVPTTYVQNDEIVLNVSHSAVGGIALTDKAIEFSARFGGRLENLYVPYGAISAIYAKENGVGTGLPLEDISEEDIEESVETVDLSSVDTTTEAPTDSKNKATSDSAPSKSNKRPSLTIVK